MDDYYLETHPPASRQFGDRHTPDGDTGAAALTGHVTAHVAVSMIDVHPPDNGAESVAAFIAGRPDPGSYHVIVDSDSAIALVRDELRAFHVAASGVNQFSWGISWACGAEDWGNYPSWDGRAMRLGAREIARFAVRWATRLGAPERAYEVARWIPPGMAIAGHPGITHHGEFQLDRSDAWEIHPQRAVLDAALVRMVREEIDRLLGVGGGDEMNAQQEAKLDEVLRQLAGKTTGPFPRPLRSAVGGDGKTSLYALLLEIRSIVKAIARKIPGAGKMLTGSQARAADKGE